MKTLINFITLYWTGLIRMFKHTPPSYHTETIERETSNFTYIEEVDIEDPCYNRKDLNRMSKLEVELIAKNMGIALSKGETKQKLIKKILKS